MAERSEILQKHLVEVEKSMYRLKTKCDDMQSKKTLHDVHEAYDLKVACHWEKNVVNENIRSVWSKEETVTFLKYMT